MAALLEAPPGLLKKTLAENHAEDLVYIDDSDSGPFWQQSFHIAYNALPWCVSRSPNCLLKLH